MIRHLFMDILWHLLPEKWFRAIPDDCEVCLGAHGGVWGNENVITPNEGGKPIVLCDYCTVHYLNDRAYAFHSGREMAR